MTIPLLSGEGPTQMADQDVCIAVGEDLSQVYPGYPWAVGANHEAGTVVIDLAVDKPAPFRQFAYMLHLSSIMGPGGQRKVREAGGELLERYGLRRGRAHEDARERAKDNGLDVSGSDEGDYWLRKIEKGGVQ
jgi:hypothetical protein